MDSKSNDQVIVLREFGSEFNANIALNLLQDAGIPAQLLGTDWPGVQGVPLPGQGMGVRLVVFARDAEAAREVIRTVED